MKKSNLVLTENQMSAQILAGIRATISDGVYKGGIKWIQLELTNKDSLEKSWMDHCF